MLCPLEIYRLAFWENLGRLGAFWCRFINQNRSERELCFTFTNQKEVKHNDGNSNTDFILLKDLSG